jgi:hypothetical protein
VYKRVGLVAGLAVVVASQVMAQGTSPVQVSSVSLAPTSFKAGTSVTFTVVLQNGPAAYGATGCVGSPYFGVTVNVTDASNNLVWHGYQALTSPLAAGERRTVPVTSAWMVPSSDTASYTVVAWSPMCGSDEFGQTAVLTIGKSCMYSYTPAFKFTPRVPKSELTRPPIILKR